MNVTNITTAIRIMEEAAERNSLVMTRWQSCAGFGIHTTLDSLHSCGNQACFAGHIAISEEWKSSTDKDWYYSVEPESGMPVIRALDPNMFGCVFSGDVAVARWLEIDEHYAEGLVHGSLVDSVDMLLIGDEYRFSKFYKKRWNEVTAEDVIIKLKEILASEQGVN